eukprot:6485047-Amphidinium_carterae.3
MYVSGTPKLNCQRLSAVLSLSRSSAASKSSPGEQPKFERRKKKIQCKTTKTCKDTGICPSRPQAPPVLHFKSTSANDSGSP